ncbi:hypothetical protein ACFWP0_23605 [Achromobacter sp. NPDC058515]|uniref:hypothetical protein n=1 Tax=Achromobacter sp. NPDC058515 TaxID=3346533 RepID=UPI003658E561
MRTAACSAPGPVQIASVGLPGGTVVRSVSNPAAIPDSQPFSVNGRPDAPYIVATDPRFVGQRPTVSSDYLFDLLRPPGAPLGNGGPGGWGSLIPAGARFLTPSGQRFAVILSPTFPRIQRALIFEIRRPSGLA